jgi:hypothetical protein
MGYPWQFTVHICVRAISLGFLWEVVGSKNWIKKEFAMPWPWQMSSFITTLERRKKRDLQRWKKKSLIYLATWPSSWWLY